MKKRIFGFVAAAAMTALFSMTAFAGSWQKDNNGWWYQHSNGSWPANGWEWIDGNADGVSECYYFDQNGYCLLNTTTPDGYQVNADGAWIVNGVVQAQGLAQTVQPQQAQSNVISPIEGGYSEDPQYIDPDFYIGFDTADPNYLYYQDPWEDSDYYYIYKRSNENTFSFVGHYYMNDWTWMNFRTDTPSNDSGFYKGGDLTIVDPKHINVHLVSRTTGENYYYKTTLVE